MPESISYLVVYNAHSGNVTKIPKPVRFLSLQKFKIHLLEAFTNHILASTDNIFLLTSFGIKLDYAMINEMSELYLYDRRLFQNPAGNGLVSQYLNQLNATPLLQLQPQEFPGLKALKESLNNQRASPSIKELLTGLKTYENWAQTVGSNVRLINDKIDALIRQINVVFKALNIVFQFASNFAASAEKLFKSQLNHVKLLAMKSLNKTWKTHLLTLQNFPPFRLKTGKVVRLSEFLNEKEFAAAAQFVSDHLPGIVLEFNSLTTTINRVNEDKWKVDKFIEVHRRQSVDTFEGFESQRAEITLKIDASLAEISADMLSLNTALLGDLERNFARHCAVCDQLFTDSKLMFTSMRNFDEFMAKLAQKCPQVFENIAIQQMKCVEVKNACKNVMAESVFAEIKEKEDLLSTVVDLPLLFGFVLVEKCRQFEWHDFYAKGIVSTVSEQLMEVLEHERVFQKLWNKKFGRLIKLLSPEIGLDVHVPAVDVTLVNSGPGTAEDSVLGWLVHDTVEREDITSYIGLIKEHQFVNNSRFGDLLQRSYKDLMASTETLKNITKTVASLASGPIQNSETLMKKALKLPIPPKDEDGRGVDEDADLNVIKGLKSRIKKLEDLLHQQQFKNLTGWPVVKNEGGYMQDTNKASLLLAPSSNSSNPSNPQILQQNAQNFVQTTQNLQNPINLLPKLASLRKLSIDFGTELSSRKVLDASTTIDKHLDNIRLRKEIGELQAQNQSLIGEKKALESEKGAIFSEREAVLSENRVLKSEKEALLSKSEELSRENKALKSTKEATLIDNRTVKNENEALLCEKQRLATELEISHTNHGLEKTEYEETIRKLQGKVDAADTTLREKTAGYDAEITLLKEKNEAEMQALNANLADNKEKLAQKSTEAAQLQVKIEMGSSKMSRDNESLQNEISELTAKLSDLQVMNAELLSNMQAKESEFCVERSETDKKIKVLQEKVDEKVEDFEDLMEMTQSKLRNKEELLCATNHALRGLLHGVAQLLESNVSYFREFCVILESMGLLLVRELKPGTNIQEFRIRRVKGLRSKKDSDDSRPSLEKTKSTAVQDVTCSFAWVSDFDDLCLCAGQINSRVHDSSTTVSLDESTDDPEVLEAETRQLLKTCESYVLDTKNGPSKLSEFLKLIAFEENVQLQAHDDGHDISKDKFFSNGIIKRFNDVEGFAKKLTKENKAKTQELTKYVKHSNSKISVRDFRQGDLVLFLPTRIERAVPESSKNDGNEGNDGDSDDLKALEGSGNLSNLKNSEDLKDLKKTITPWTAFNIDAPHYFLDLASRTASISGEEWLVARISNITEHLVTAENAANSCENPFSLSVGITWFLVSAE